MATFTTPTANDVPRVLPDSRGPGMLLARHYSNLPRGRSVVLVAGHYQTVDVPTTDQLVAAGAEGTGYFLGGHVYTVTSAVATALAADGYTTSGMAAAIALSGSSDNITTPDSAGNSISGDIDLRMRVNLADWTPAGAQLLADKWSPPSDRHFQWYLGSDGKLNFGVSTTGANQIFGASTVATGITDGTTYWVRVTRASATGQMVFYTSSDGVSWPQLGTPVSATSGALFNSNAAVAIGGSAGSGVFLDGKVYYFEMRDGIGGTVVQSFDPSGVVILGTRNPSTVAAGGPWTINGSGWDWTVT